MSGDDFLWGAATAAFQIEGATREDGRGESIWDRFAADGHTANGDSGDPACDHYHRWAEDLDLMGSLGLQGYRFSLSWPRIQPDGRGRPNRRGLDFYRRLAEGLRGRGIAPLATLYHWDLPQALQDEGGWASRDVVERFAEYAEIAFGELDGLVDSWLTHNEPWVVAFLGYGYGVKAPGIRDWRSALRAAHHVLLSHGVAVQRFRAGGHPGRIGITLDLTVARPASDSPEDLAAARRLDGHRNRWFLEPVLRGSYPADMLAWYEERVGLDDLIHDGDLAAISQPIDLLGVNFYRPSLVAADPDEPVHGLRDLDFGDEHTAMGWPVDASGLTELLVRLQRDYAPPPVYITENGAAYEDFLNGGEVVEDEQRVAYLRDHIAAVDAARGQGADVRGYYVWSLLDNFEWEYGYEKRFGIVYVDFPSQRRVLKRSALWYRDLIATRTNGNGR